jgi:hypothetical protein
MVDSLKQAVMSNSRSKVFLISQKKYLDKFSNAYSQVPSEVELVDSGSIPVSKQIMTFGSTSILPKSLNGGLWWTSAERLFLIEDFMEMRRIETVVHVESDVMLYVDLSISAAQMRALYPRLAVTPLKQKSFTASVLFVNNRAALHHLNQFALRLYGTDEKLQSSFFKWVGRRRRAELNEMAMLAFYYEHTQHVLRQDSHMAMLPVLPFGKHSEHHNCLNAVFDGGSWGQFVGGVNWAGGPRLAHEPGFFDRNHIVGHELGDKNCDVEWGWIESFRSGHRGLRGTGAGVENFCVPFSVCTSPSGQQSKSRIRIADLHIHAKTNKKYLSSGSSVDRCR